MLLQDQPRGLSGQAALDWRAEAEAAFRAVRELAVLVEDYLDWKRKRRLSTQAVARNIRVSRERLGAFERGDNFFKWDLPRRIRSYFDPSPEREGDRPPGTRRGRR